MADRTVIFLGAGASAADGAPIQSTLLRDYFLFRRRHARDRIACNPHWDSELATFFLDFFGIDVDDEASIRASRFPTFEEILGIVEVATSQDEAFRDWSSYSLVSSSDRLRSIHDLLVFSIAEILDDALTGRAVVHPRLVEVMKDKGTLRDATFVSLNYDILIDNALLAQHAVVDLDYGINFANYTPYRRGTDEWHAPRTGRSVPLYKLHGSLNWLYCPACRSVELTPMEKRIAKYRTDPGSCICKACDAPCVPVIVPPTFFKVFGNLFLREIWHKAEMATSEADRIVFCGYSFPDADVHVRYLLKHAELREMKRRKVFIVNEHGQKQQAERDAEWDRYVRFFRDKGTVHWTNLGFQQFAGDSDAVEDPANWNTTMRIGK